MKYHKSPGADVGVNRRKMLKQMSVAAFGAVVSIVAIAEERTPKQAVADLGSDMRKLRSSQW
ncbi:MAG TPA: hypothetical protein VGL34_17075 [Steroidobacteraceae bacterium]|jgi:hypothetical protein